MIQLPRSFVRQLRSALRRSFSRVISPIMFSSGADGLSIRCQQEGIAVAYQSNQQGSDQFVLPAQALSDLEGKSHDLVNLEVEGTKIVASWQDSGVPRVVEYEMGKADALPFPSPPARFTTQDAGLRKALDDAMQSAAHDTVRFALNKIQIRGSSGVIAATDGHQLLWQNGYQFPFKDDVLVPRTNVFGCRELEGEVSIGKTKTHLCLRVGPWTIFLLIDDQGRFPRYESIIPSNTTNATSLRFTMEDSAFLTKALPRLPGNDGDHSAVTLDLNGEAVVRARGEDQDHSTDVVLSRATVSGNPVRYAIGREHLALALDLGFIEGHVINVDSPILFQDECRKLVIQGVGKAHALPPTPNDVRLRSDSSAITTNHEPVQRRNEPMRSSRPPVAQASTAPAPAEHHDNNSNHAATDGNGSTNGQVHQKAGFNALLEEAQSIQNGLRDLLLRTNQLLVGLKAYRRHAKTMQSTLASLRQLQQVEA